ncbi:MAG TPA: TfoX/Sxy family protein [Anaerolineaceae bacterium]|nr:TfoX/Sxy family protein [Anaerolineaceae bacterium]
MDSLSKLPNIGKVLERNLNDIGIYTQKQLVEMGGKNAFIRIKQMDNGACLHMLYAIQGAIEGVKYPQLAVSTKQDLKHFFDSL